MRKRFQNNSDPRDHTKSAAQRIALSLTAAIKDAHPKLSLREAEHLTAIPYGTIGGWLHSDDVERLRFILIKLALLPSTERAALLDRYCPQFPNAAHDFFDPDPLLRDHLLRLAEKQSGTTIVIGGSIYWTSFICAALVNSSVAFGSSHVSGIDACIAHDLAPAECGSLCACLLPVPGVAYIAPAPESEFKRNVEIACRRIFHRPRKTSAASSSRSVQRFLFNGVWKVLASHRSEIASLGQRAHVIVGIDSQSQGITTDLAKPIHVMEISNVPSLRVDSFGRLKLRISEVRG
jgi:hypothetical protein